MKPFKIFPFLLALLFLLSVPTFAEESGDISSDVSEESTDAPVQTESYTITYGYYVILYNDKEPIDYIKGKTPAPCSVAAGDSHTVLKNPYRFRDYIFDGWSDGTRKYAEGEVIYNVRSDIKLTATWRRGDSAELVTYGRFSYGNGKEFDVRVGDTVTLESGTWVDADGRFFDGGSKFLMSRHFATLTSATKPASLVSVSYDGNGGNGGMQCGFGIADGTAFTVDGCFAKRDGYEFIGWEDASGKIYLPGDSCIVNGDMKLTAQWQESTKPLPDYCTVNIKLGEGGTATPSGKQTVMKGESIEIVFTPDNGNKLISVRRDGEELGTGGKYTLVVTADTKIEAEFEIGSGEVSEEESLVEESIAPETTVAESKEESFEAVSNDSGAPIDEGGGNTLKVILIIIAILAVGFFVLMIVYTVNDNKKRRKRGKRRR